MFDYLRLLFHLIKDDTFFCYLDMKALCGVEHSTCVCSLFVFIFFCYEVVGEIECNFVRKI